MARKERTIKNSVAAIAKYFIKMVLQFVLRTIIIYKLGVEYVGLDALYANIISMLSMAELGIGSAIVFSMYKPAAENDVEKLKSLNALYKKMYLIIASIVLVIGISISPFLKYLINGEPNVSVNLYVIYFIFLANTVISYLGAHKKSLLFAHQRNDVESNVATSVLVVMAIAQIVGLLAFDNYYVYAIMTPIFTLLEVLIIVIIANKFYPNIRGKAKPLDKETKKQVTKNIVGSSLHQIGSVLVLSTDNLLISMFFGLNVLGKVSNYILIYNAINNFIMIFTNALQASVGNLIATSSKERVYKIYKMFNWIFACVVGFCSISLICLYQHFIGIWVGYIYLLNIYVVLVMIIRFYVTKMRSLTNVFKNCAGLMWNDKLRPIFETIVNIVVSIILLKVIGVAGVFVGTIISTVVVPLWVEPYVLYKHYFNKSMKDYFISYGFYTLVTLIGGFVAFALCSLLPTYGIWWFIIKGIIVVCVTSIVFLLSYFKTNEFKILFNEYIKPIINKFKRKKG